MRNIATIAVLTLIPGMIPAAEKLTEEDRIELIRGLTSEYATVKSLLPRARKPLEFTPKALGTKNNGPT